MLASVLTKTWILHTVFSLVSRNVFVVKQKCLFDISVMLLHCCCWYWANIRPKFVDLPRKVQNFSISQSKWRNPISHVTCCVIFIFSLLRGACVYCYVPPHFCSFIFASTHQLLPNVGLISQTIIPSVINLCVVITTIKLYATIILLVIFDLYLGHRVSLCAKEAVLVSQEPRMSSGWNLVWI